MRPLMIVIARLTVLELVRRRVVWVLAILPSCRSTLVGLGLDRLVDLARDRGDRRAVRSRSASRRCSS